MQNKKIENTKDQPVAAKEIKPQAQPAGEVGGPKGLEPTRYGDWELNGRCTDF